MSARVNKSLFVMIILAICFIVACAKATTNSASVAGDNVAPVVTSTVCYPGIKKDNSACVPLMNIDAKTLGYRDPYKDATFPSGLNPDQYRLPIHAVNLSVANSSLGISPNFLLGEVMEKVKGNFGIFSSDIMNIVQQLRTLAKSPINLNSAFRPPLYNEGVDGSALWSRHQYGDAVDVASSVLNLNQLAALCTKLGATYVDKYVVHVHCDWRAKKIQPQFFGALANPKMIGLENLNEDEQVMQTRSDVIQSVFQASQIQVQGQLIAGQTVEFTSQVDYKEDAEDLYKKWIVFAPNGQRYESESQNIKVVLQKGTYQVIHYIGANIQLNKSFFVN